MFWKRPGMIKEEQNAGIVTSAFSVWNSWSVTYFLFGLTALLWRSAATCSAGSIPRRCLHVRRIWRINLPGGLFRSVEITGAAYPIFSRDSDKVGSSDLALHLFSLDGTSVDVFASRGPRKPDAASSPSDERNVISTARLLISRRIQHRPMSKEQGILTDDDWEEMSEGTPTTLAKEFSKQDHHLPVHR